MLNVLVTGGCGFIGSNLCNRLIELGYYVICVDNLSTGNINNINKLKKNSNFEFIRHDITVPLYIQVDLIYHLACPASPPAYQKQPIKTIKTGVIGTINMLGLAKRVNATILLTSTSEIYGNPEISPQIEEYVGHVNPIGVRSCYDESKRIAETLMIEYNRSHNVDIRIARIFNTYGPNMDINDGRVISNFINQSINNLDITINGDGKQTRSFCYIDDTVDGLIKLMNNKYQLPINIGNPDEQTILDIAKKILYLTKSNSKIIYRNLPSEDPLKRKPDIKKAKHLLNWEPKISLIEGVSKTIDYFKKSNQLFKNKY